MAIFIDGLKYFIVGFCIALAFTAKVFGAAAPLEVEGVITMDTTWTGDVLVFSDVLVPEGVTLTVLPGTTVRFAYSESSKIEPMFLSMRTELLVRGVLKVSGDKDHKVRFMPAPEEVNLKKPEKGDWGGIIFDGEAASASIITGADIVMAETGITTFYSSPTITGCEISDSDYGFLLAGPSKPKIKGCRVTGAGYALVASHGAAPEVTDCVFEGNEHDILR